MTFQPFAQSSGLDGLAQCRTVELSFYLKPLQHQDDVLATQTVHFP